jgi:hypothetical protein
MISFNNLGKMGRLGNQMFQYAALKGIAKHKGYWYSVPSDTDLSKCFEISNTFSNKNKTSVSIDGIEFDEYLFNNCPDDVDLIGYFQSEKYFKHIEDEIRKDFTFYGIIDRISSHYIKTVFSNSKVISCHVRRSDYLTDSGFENLSLEYYYDALDLLPNLPVIVLSDDPEWCRENFKQKRFKISFSNNSFIDLCLMSKCDYHIIANSSYSWWGSWLAKSKKTIAPKKWFSGNYKDWNTSDLYLPGWVSI